MFIPVMFSFTGKGKLDIIDPYLFGFILVAIGLLFYGWYLMYKHQKEKNLIE